MYKEILIPVDGSRFGERALPVGLGIAAEAGGRVRIVTVITPLPMDDTQEDSFQTEEGRLLLAVGQAEAYHEELEARLRREGFEVPISYHVEPGQVVDALDRHVRDSGTDLLVMTTHGRGPLRRAWLGSVADGLLRRTPCPILAIRPREGEEPNLRFEAFRHMVITMDGSVEARNILPFAEGLAGTSMAQLTLLQVIPRQYPLTAPYTSHASHGFQGLDAETAVADAEKALDRIAPPLRERGFRVETETVWGAHPAEGILEFVESHDVDVIAMETHGRGGVARLILGSVADKVIRGATVPVLLHRSETAGDRI